ncbi:hypothetical protein EUX98_g9558 [Antrodiella citrinella]|uniref:Uncharacterized protein n=1 Tax=Antrodiella citrinella TaxID=2447956 RepID=A0A4S4LS45_9APHY|nr:hypothetical protein EUX98_g9558 [Antrodiella citrinella]
MLQQLGMCVSVDEVGAPVWGDTPKRLQIHAEFQESEHTPNKHAVTSMPRNLVSYVRGISRPDTKPAHLHSTRATLPSVRTHGASYRLIPRTAEKAALYEAEHKRRKDALSPLYDRLATHWLWHVLEWIPMRVKTQKVIVHMVEDASGYTSIWNRGRGRKVPKSEMEEGIRVHRSVKTRLEAGAAFDDYEGLKLDQT